MDRCENPLQSRHSQGYLSAHVQRLSYAPGGPDHGLDLSASAHSSVLARARALLPAPAPAGLQMALGAPPRLRRTGQPQGIGPAWPSTAGLSALPPAVVCGLRVHQDAALVVRRPRLAGLASAGRWSFVSGRRQHAEEQAGQQASGGPPNALEPRPSLCFRLSARHFDGPVGRLSYPLRLRAAPAQRRAALSARKRPVSPAAARFPAASEVPEGGGYRSCRLRRSRQSGPYAGTEVWVCQGAPPHLEVCQREGAQSPRHSSATLAGYPASNPHNQHATSPDLLSLCQTSAAPPAGTS
jgi:hypothetical protein